MRKRIANVNGYEICEVVSDNVISTYYAFRIKIGSKKEISFQTLASATKWAEKR